MVSGKSFVLQAAICFLLAAGCASTSKEPKDADVRDVESARELGGDVAGPWTLLEDGITNLVPDENEVEAGQVRDGSGVSTGLVKNFKARDLTIMANVSFAGDGAPGLVFRAEEKDGAIASMFAVALYAQGINIWRLKDGNWRMLESRVAPMKPRVPHALRVDAKGKKITVFADGQQITELEQEDDVAEGRAGVRATEGACKFSNLRVGKR